MPLNGGGSQSAVIPSSASSGAAEETCFYRAPSAGRYQWKYCIIVPLHALMRFLLSDGLKYRGTDARAGMNPKHIS